MNFALLIFIFFVVDLYYRNFLQGDGMTINFTLHYPEQFSLNKIRYNETTDTSYYSLSHKQFEQFLIDTELHVYNNTIYCDNTGSVIGIMRQDF